MIIFVLSIDLQSAFVIAMPNKLRIGAVQYLNSKPLIECLPSLFPDAEIVTDVPSRLADGLSGGRFDVALIPSVETLRLPEVRVVSDACVACDGPVRSVKLFGACVPRANHDLGSRRGLAYQCDVGSNSASRSVRPGAATAAAADWGTGFRV